MEFQGGKFPQNDPNSAKTENFHLFQVVFVQFLSYFFAQNGLNNSTMTNAGIQ